MKLLYGGTRHSNTQTKYFHSIAGLVRIVCDTEVSSNTEQRIGGDPNGSQCQPCDVDAIDGEDSPLQSKRSSRFLN